MILKPYTPLKHEEGPGSTVQESQGRGGQHSPAIRLLVAMFGNYCKLPQKGNRQEGMALVGRCEHPSAKRVGTNMLRLAHTHIPWLHRALQHLE